MRRFEAGGAIAAGLVAAAAAGGVVALARRHFVVVIVDGTSMVPTFGPDDHLLARRLRAGAGRVRRGDIVVVDHDGARGIKRVTGVAGDLPPGAARRLGAGELWIVGDQAGSIDSRSYGPIRRSQVLARVIGRVSRGSSRGAVVID